MTRQPVLGTEQNHQWHRQKRAGVAKGPDIRPEAEFQSDWQVINAEVRISAICATKSAKPRGQAVQLFL